MGYGGIFAYGPVWDTGKQGYILGESNQGLDLDDADYCRDRK